jgi:uncharacterized membrane protein YbhN (UPF0104 family)
MKARITTAGKWVLAILILLAIAGTLRTSWNSIFGLAATCDFRWLWAAGLAALVYRVLNAAGWGIVLRSLGQSLPVLTGIRLWLIAETMRWLPGSVWGYYARVHQAQRAGIPVVPASLSMPLELVITVFAWVLTAAAGGVGIGRVIALSLPALSAGTVWGIAGVLAGSVAAGFSFLRRHPQNRFARKLRGLLRDLAGIVHARPRLIPLSASLGWFVGLCFFNGAAFYTVLRALTAHAPTLCTAVGINAFGWLIGFFAIFSPGGLGVREAGMTALLIPFVPLEIAVGSVVLWRVLQIIAEIICLGFCYLPSAVSLLSSKHVSVGARGPSEAHCENIP